MKGGGGGGGRNLTLVFSHTLSILKASKKLAIRTNDVRSRHEKIGS